MFSIIYYSLSSGSITIYSEKARVQTHLKESVDQPFHTIIDNYDQSEVFVQNPEKKHITDQIMELVDEVFLSLVSLSCN